jgi:hypothetical protein
VETRAENKTGRLSPGTGPAGDGLISGRGRFWTFSRGLHGRPFLPNCGLAWSKTIGKQAKLSLPVHAHTGLTMTSRPG